MLIKRKEFLQLGTLATASMMMPKFLKAFEKPMMVPPGNKVVVVIQFSGGNDGLNTVIPVRNDIYYRERPVLGISKDKSLLLTEEVGLNPALEAFKTLYDDGSLAILNNVGYPNPDRSHFRSMDIWQSASESNVYIQTGWLGRYLDAQCKGCDKPTQAVELDDILSMALKGEDNKGLAFKDPKKLYNISNGRFIKDVNANHTSSEETIDYLYKTMSATLAVLNIFMSKAGYTPHRKLIQILNWVKI
ncbi:MAG: hypothetical protein R2765_03745 [Ferruginibacter sp.]